MKIYIVTENYQECYSNSDDYTRRILSVHRTMVGANKAMDEAEKLAKSMDSLYCGYYCEITEQELAE